MKTTPSRNHSRLKAVAGQVLPITKYYDPILKTRCSAAREISPDLLARGFDMLATLSGSVGALIGITLGRPRTTLCGLILLTASLASFWYSAT